MSTTYWRIDWLVPAAQAIGGEAYWDPFEDARRIGTLEEAREMYAKAQVWSREGEVRLVRVEEHVEE